MSEEIAIWGKASQLAKFKFSIFKYMQILSGCKWEIGLRIFPMLNTVISHLFWVTIVISDKGSQICI